MPYKRIGKAVKVRKRGHWETLKVHESEEKAEAHLKALYANVPEAKEEKGQ